MSGWEAGIRTPIDRSRVPKRTNQINRMKSLALQKTEKAGKIRNADAMKNDREVDKPSNRAKPTAEDTPVTGAPCAWFCAIPSARTSESAHEIWMRRLATLAFRLCRKCSP